MTIFRRKKKDPPPPAPPEFQITDADRLEYFLGKTAAGREAIDAILMADKKWVRRKRIATAIETVEASRYMYVTSESIDKLRAAKALLASLGDVG